MAHLPLALHWRILAALALGAATVASRAKRLAAMRDCRGLRLAADGTAAILNRAGDWIPARLLAGSVLTAKWGWLRFKTVDGRQFQELIAGDRRQMREWRRLHILWRFFGVDT